MISLTAVATVLLVGWLVKKLIDFVKQQSARLSESALPERARGASHAPAVPARLSFVAAIGEGAPDRRMDAAPSPRRRVVVPAVAAVTA